MRKERKEGEKGGREERKEGGDKKRIKSLTVKVCGCLEFSLVLTPLVQGPDLLRNENVTGWLVE